MLIRSPFIHSFRIFP